MRLKLFFLVLLVHSVSFAVDYGFPIGHREAFLANSGGAMIDSPGNVVINPAGLGFRKGKESSLTVSGQAISRQEFAVSQYAVDPEEMSIRPLLAAGVYPTSLGTAAVFIANPQSFKLYAGNVSTQVGVNIRSLLRIDNEELLAGASLANQGNANFSWGVSAGLEIETQKSYGYTTALKTGVTAMTVFNQTDQKTTSVFVLPGVLYKLNDNWNMGFSMKFRPVTLSSSATTLTSRMSSTDPTTIEETRTSFDPQGTSPLSFRLGQEVVLFSNHHIYVDVVYKGSGSAYNANNEKFLNDEIWLGSLGYRGSQSEMWEPLAGYSRGKTGTTDTDLITAGASFKRRSNEFIFGAFYFGSLGRGDSSSSFNSYGIMFSSNVEY